MEELNNALEVLEDLFGEKSNSENGLSMSKYMKGRFPFYGINASARKEIQRTWFKKYLSHLSDESRRIIVQELWQKEQREFHYVAIDWMNSWKKNQILKEDVELLKWLITNNSWWDSVDSIASNYLGKYISLYPEKGQELIEEWRHEDNLWLNRSCLIFQLKHGNRTDFDLLKSLIIQYQPNKEFFIQKAIGWSLRQYSKFQPALVRSFVEEINLKGLALKEASKYL
jgi:3-methyladenine DNA glycosylase AlkD